MLNGYNSGFFRPNALLTIVVVTDEPEQGLEGFGQDFEPTNWVDWLVSLKGGNPFLTGFCALAGFDPVDNFTPADCSSLVDTAMAAPRLRQVADSLPLGFTGSICSQDWTPFLLDCGFATTGMEIEFGLEDGRPDIDREDWDDDGDRRERAIRVETKRLGENQWIENEGGKEWHYDAARNSIVFRTDTAPPDGSLIRVTYIAATVY